MKMIYVELKREGMVSCHLESGKKLTFEKGLTKISVEEAEELGDIPALEKLIEDKVLVARPEIGCIENREPKKAKEEVKEPVSTGGEGEGGTSGDGDGGDDDTGSGDE